MMTYQKIDHPLPVLEHYKFEDEHFSCSIFPGLGGSIQELIVNKTVLIKSIALNEQGIAQYYKSYASSLLFPYPNRIDGGKYTHEDENYQLAINEDNLNNSIHGLIYAEKFEVARISTKEISLIYRHQKSDGFPFAYDFTITYSFREGGISMKFEVTNTGKKSFPFGMGWHPYFELESYGNTSVQFQADKTYQVDQRFLPTLSQPYNKKEIMLEQAQLDTAYKLTNGKVKLISPNYDLTLELPTNSFLQLFTPPDRSSVAVEPMTCISNAFNNGRGLKTLAPQTSYDWSIALDVLVKNN